MVQIALLVALAAASVGATNSPGSHGATDSSIKAQLVAVQADATLHIGRHVIDSHIADGRQELRLIRDGKTVAGADLTALAAEWLADDAFWGGHENANQVRYLVDRYGGMLRADLTECMPYPDGTAVGVLSLRTADSWQKPTAAQVLIVLGRNPFKLASFRVLRAVGAPDPAPYGATQRLYRLGAKTYLVDGSDVSQIDALGRAARHVLTLPARTAPDGMGGGRWVVAEQLLDTRGGMQWIACDLTNGEILPFLNVPWAMAYPSTETIHLGRLDPKSPYVLFERRTFRPERTEFFTVRIDNGEQAGLAGPAGQIVGQYAANDMPTGPHSQAVTLYSAKTGRLLRTISVSGG